MAVRREPETEIAGLYGVEQPCHGLEENEMKINLTKLLESPTRVKWIKEPEPNTTAYYIEKEYQSTASKTLYSFELEASHD